MRLRAYGLYLLRDSRGARGRLLLFGVCLAFGVAAVVSVAALSEGLDGTVRREAKQLLGGDLRASSQGPIPESLGSTLAVLHNAQSSDLKQMLTMVAVPEAGTGSSSRLVEMAAVDHSYPLYGALVTQPSLPLETLLSDQGLVIAPELASQLRLNVGDSLRVGDSLFTVRGLLIDEPGHALNPFQIGPRVLMNSQDLQATGLETFGSRIRYQRFYRVFPDIDIETLETTSQSLEAEIAESSHGIRMTTYLDSQAGIRESLERLSRFLGLVALLSLLVGGVGVAQSVRSFLASRLDAIATLKCLGLRPREALGLYLGQTFLLALIGSVAGGFLGLWLQLYAPGYLGTPIPPDTLAFWRPRALAQGIGLGLVTSVCFSLAPLLSVLTVPPLRALRRDATPIPTHRFVRGAVGLVLLGGLFGIAYVQANEVLSAALFTAGVLSTVSLLLGGAWFLRRQASVLQHTPLLPFTVRHGAAQLARPGSATLTATTALGLGTFVILTTVLVQQHLTTQLESELPSGAPGTFLIGIQPDQWDPVHRELKAVGATNIDSVPEILGRLVAVDDRPIHELTKNANEDQRWALTREQRITYLNELPPDNTLVDGVWWTDPNRAEISLEEEFALELGATIGSLLTFDIQGVPIEVEVTNLRQVEWRTFRINYFLVMAPGVLEAAPQTRLAAATIPSGQEQAVQDRILQRFPNITFIDVRSMLRQLSDLLKKLASGVRFLGGFTAVAGLVILFGSVASTSVRRSGDLALFRALGLTRRDAAMVLLAELGLTGLVASAIGSLTAGMATWAIATHLLDVDPHLFPGTHLSILALTLLATCSAGTAAGLQALRASPAEVFRQETE